MGLWCRNGSLNESGEHSKAKKFGVDFVDLVANILISKNCRSFLGSGPNSSHTKQTNKPKQTKTNKQTNKS